MRVEQAACAVERFRRSGEATLGKRYGSDATMRGPSGMQAFGPGPVGKAFGDAGALARGNTNRILHLLWRQPEDFASREGGADRAEHAGRMIAVIVEGAWRHGAEPRRQFAAGNDRCE